MVNSHYIVTYFTWCINCIWRRFRVSTIHLYTFLTVMEQNIYKNISIITGGFLVFHLIFDLDVLLYIGVGVSVGSALIPSLGKLINWMWMKLALGLGWFNSRVLLSIIYFVFLFPIAMISRIFNRDSLNINKRGESYYTNRNHIYQKEDLENIW